MENLLMESSVAMLFLGNTSCDSVYPRHTTVLNTTYIPLNMFLSTASTKDTTIT